MLTRRRLIGTFALFLAASIALHAGPNQSGRARPTTVTLKIAGMT